MSDSYDERGTPPLDEDEEPFERPGERPINVGLIVGITVAAAVFLGLISTAFIYFMLRQDVGKMPFSTPIHAFEARQQMSNLESAVNAYRMANRRLPDSLETLTAADARNPEGYLRSIPNDPWGQAYEYRLLSSHAYEIRCYGADELPDTEDDIVVRSD